MPEASDYIASSAAETVSLARSIRDSEFVLGLQKEARSARLPVNVGIHEPAQGGHKVKNTLIWIDQNGDITKRYQKVHLFDVDITGGPVFNESSRVEKGMEITPPFEAPVGRLGMAICFDVRHSITCSPATIGLISYGRFISCVSQNSVSHSGDKELIS